MQRFLAILRLGLLRLVLAAGVLTIAATDAPAIATAAETNAASGAMGASGFDPVAATQQYMDRLSGEARARSDAYAEGGYWLMLWNLLLGLAIYWFLLASRWSTRIRKFAERRTAKPALHALIYVLAFIPLTALLGFPLTLYQDYIREHQYGLSNLNFGDWLGEQLIGLGVSMVLMGIALTGLYAILRRVPRTWWAWGTAAGAGFMLIVFMIAPVFIAPLFNKYVPLEPGPIREQIMSLARANGIPAEHVYTFNASKQTKRISANVSGLFGTTRISLNDNLLNRTSPAEIRAVMAHEMGHYVLNHALCHTLSFSLLMMIGLLFVRVSWDWAAARWGTRYGVRGIDDPAGLPLLAALFSLFVFFATPVTNLLIRTAESEADLYGLNASREPDGFAEAIFKLAEYRKLEPGRLEELIFYHHPSGYNRIFAAMRWKAEQLRQSAATHP